MVNIVMWKEIFVMIILYYFIYRFIKWSYYGVKSIIKNKAYWVSEYVNFGIGIGPGMSGFSLVEVLKGSTDVNGWALIGIFIAGIWIYEMSRRIKNKTS